MFWVCSTTSKASRADDWPTQRVADGRGQKGDRRQPHVTPRSVSASDLEGLGISYYHLPELSQVDELAYGRGYVHRDEITVSPEALGGQDAFDARLKVFFNEHLHEDEEIRYVVDGTGYFDVRSSDDEWVRIELEKADLIILPAGIYHRFTTGQGNVSGPCLRYVRLLFAGAASRHGEILAADKHRFTHAAVHQSHASLQIRSAVDAPPPQRRRREEPFPPGVPPVEGG